MTLLIYRSTPIIDGKSQAEILNNGRMADRCHGNRFSQSFERAIMERKLKQKQYYNRNTTEQSQLSTGQTVRLRDQNDKTWDTRSKVLNQVAPRSYLVQTEGGKIYRRHRKDILQCNEQFIPTYGDNHCNVMSGLIGISSQESSHDENTQPLMSDKYG
ncbi:hypothetical protein FSP39_004211 [Pinctada imbricata]|uniref:Uncharacterized protein n=1 Tax=Pinctada imbricata TaxID=66713 RepID=A0AA88YJT2_PINIB|nr:hypothetical protein FSP39_004211 [Pinctada imbricata]